MGAELKYIKSFNEFSSNELGEEQSEQVFHLSLKVLEQVFIESPETKYSHFVVTTTCPDSLAPSLGQALADHYNEELGDCQIIDMVQGCAGGVSAMILASKLATATHSSILLLSVDAAKKATSSKSEMYSIFGNGAFACKVSNGHPTRRLIHSKSKQFKGLSKVVKVNLGHDADQIIKQEPGIQSDPRMHLGLNMNKALAIKLLRQAEGFYKEFVQESTKPDVLILHQVNPTMIATLKVVFSKYELEFVDVAKQTGNCGSATTGIALAMKLNELKDKKVMICSFGTGGIITAGMWQF